MRLHLVVPQKSRNSYEIFLMTLVNFFYIDMDIEFSVIRASIFMIIVLLSTANETSEFLTLQLKYSITRRF